MTPNNQQFTITARPSAMSPDERAARLAQAYDPLLAVYDRLVTLAENARKQAAETAVSGEGANEGRRTHED